MSEEGEGLSTRQVAEALGVTRHHVAALLAAGVVPSWEVPGPGRGGRQLRVAPESLEALRRRKDGRHRSAHMPRAPRATPPEVTRADLDRAAAVSRDTLVAAVRVSQETALALSGATRGELGHWRRMGYLGDVGDAPSLPLATVLRLARIVAGRRAGLSLPLAVRVVDVLEATERAAAAAPPAPPTPPARPGHVPTHSPAAAATPPPEERPVWERAAAKSRQNRWATPARRGPVNGGT